MESRNVKNIEKILHSGVATGACAFYADACASNQRAKNEKNHTFHRRFLGHGKLSKFSQSAIQEITNFINNYTRRKFYGKSASEVRNMLLKGESPQIRPPQLKKMAARSAQKIAQLVLQFTIDIESHGFSPFDLTTR